MFGKVVAPPVITGSVRSILIPFTDADAELPALSETPTGPAPRLAPSPVIALSAGTVDASTPESASLAVQWIVTSPLYQPAAFGASVAAPERSGSVRSMLISSTILLFLLPALSVAVPVMLWASPSAVSVLSPTQPPTALTPVSASSQAKATETGPWFQPNAFAAGVRVLSIDGSRSSILTSIEFATASLFSTLPALSTLQNVIVWIPPASKVNGPSYASLGAPSTL